MGIGGGPGFFTILSDPQHHKTQCLHFADANTEAESRSVAPDLISQELAGLVLKPKAQAVWAAKSPLQPLLRHLPSFFRKEERGGGLRAAL